MFAPPTPDAIAPTPQDAKLARESSAVLAPFLHDTETTETPHILLRSGTNREADIALPSSVLKLLLGALEEMGKGNAVTLLPLQAELTTQQAAELMRVSRPSLIKMLDERKLPFRKVGAHRRVRYADVLRYLEVEHSRRVKVMEELMEETERLGLY